MNQYDDLMAKLDASIAAAKGGTKPQPQASPTPTPTPKEGTTTMHCQMSGCENPKMDDSYYCDEHRCTGRTKAGDRCKVNLNCHASHTAKFTQAELSQMAADSRLAQAYINKEAPLNEPTTPEQEKAMDEIRAQQHSELVYEQKFVTQYERKPLYIISFSGHRPNKLGGYQPNPIRTMVKRAMLAKVQAAIVKYGDTHEIVIVWGGALGVDQWAAQLANHLGLRHCCIIPFGGFEGRWPKASQEEFAALLRTCDMHLAEHIFSLPEVAKHKLNIAMNGVIYCRDRADVGYFQLRNMVMVDASDAMIVVWDGSNGGTKNCVDYINHVNKPMVRINPTEL